MALTAEAFTDRITVTKHGVIEVLSRTVIRDGDTVVASNTHRSTFAPGSDVSGQDARVQAVAEATWTPEVIAEWQALTGEDL